MSQKSIKLAILTDMHAFTKANGVAPSWIDLSQDQSNPKINPFAGLQELLSRDSNILADLVVCGGDLGDKASPEGQQYVWQEVNKLVDPLKAKLVVATAGNHDVDSRMVNTKYDARGQLQALVPRFPIADQIKWMEYWAKHYTTFEMNQVRFVLLNSAAYHGYQAPNGDPEYLHGRISDRTLDRLVEDLTASGRYAANVLICHHHPLKNDQVKVAEYSHMENGDRLVNTLVDAKVGPWLIIHGHKHLPRIIHAPGGNTAPTIFSAGSFSAALYPEYGDKARNEFYILELEIPPSVSATSNLKGSISTWEWTYGNGWQRSRVGKGLGPRAAFGARIDIAAEAAKTASKLKAQNPGSSTLWDEVCAGSPFLNYLIPEDLAGFLEYLRADHGIRPLHDENGEVCELRVPKNA
ncbi:metallophosphoesterase family protein [Aminobacter ciceronei]|jgi:Icc-related predicted phosphoesterase|uniref:metallophosphoesterase family protein n=1 Tax=Aminobacter ciceronei TaxID=150723 RepID=UPI003F704A48